MPSRSCRAESALASSEARSWKYVTVAARAEARSSRSATPANPGLAMAAGAIRSWKPWIASST